ncbi:hypothetical protein BYT27DRAFT_7195912 [Phlegmacium glaucopus]|nr:hypothetical protein BYT27DRAFT_7195912 [Phlegmacium glaucopus]
MGNFKDTAAILQKLADGKLAALCTNMNKLLDAPVEIPAKPTPEDLRNLLQMLTEQQFQKQFNYPYKGDQSSPPRVAMNAKDRIYGVQDICSITDSPSDQIAKYVDSRLLITIQQDWVRVMIRNPLEQQAGSITDDLSDHWVVWPFVKTYDSPQNPEENSFQLNAIIAYCKVPVPKSESCSIVYYTGIHYEIVSPTKAAKTDLLLSLIENANALLDKPVEVPASPSVNDLEKVLGYYGKKIFGAQFGFPYDGVNTHPDDAVTNTAVSGISTLCSIEDVSQPDALLELINERVLSVVEIPTWAQNPARATLQNAVASLMNGPRSNAWLQITFEEAYHSLDTAENSCKTVAKLIYSKASFSNSVTVNRWSVYYIGIYYEILSPYTSVRNELMRRLYKAAVDLVPEVLPYPSSPTVQDLSKVLDIYGRRRFHESYGFPYDGDQTKPGDASPDTQILAKIAMFEILDNKPETLEKLILQTIPFPNWLPAIAKDDLLNVTKEFLSVNTNFTWETQNLRVVYPNTQTTSGSIQSKTSAILTYSNSTLTEDATITVTFIHYIGIYYYRIPPPDIH